MVEDGLACAVFTRRSKRTNGKGVEKSAVLVTLGGGNNPVPPVILSKLYSRQDAQD